MANATHVDDELVTTSGKLFTPVRLPPTLMMTRLSASVSDIIAPAATQNQLRNECCIAVSAPGTPSKMDSSSLDADDAINQSINQLLLLLLFYLFIYFLPQVVKIPGVKTKKS